MRRQHPLTRRTPATDLTLQLLVRALHVCVSLTYRHHTCTCGTVPLYVSETAASTSGYRSSPYSMPKSIPWESTNPKSNTKGRIPMNTPGKHTNTWKIVYTKRIRTSDRSCPVPDPSTPSPETPLRASLFDGYVAYPASLTRRRPPRQTRHVNTV
jgi:hypothetical protein